MCFLYVIDNATQYCCRLCPDTIHSKVYPHTHTHTPTHAHMLTCSIPHVPCVTVQGRCFPVTDHHLIEVRKLIGWRGPIDEESPDTNVDFVAEVVSYIAHSQSMVSEGYIITMSENYTISIAYIRVA